MPPPPTPHPTALAARGAPRGAARCPRRREGVCAQAPWAPSTPGRGGGAKALPESGEQEGGFLSTPAEPPRLLAAGLPCAPAPRGGLGPRAPGTRLAPRGSARGDGAVGAGARRSGGRGVLRGAGSCGRSLCDL